MNKINISAVPTDHRRSPKGRFELHRQHVSLASGGIKDVGPWGGGHPFDIELATLPPGKANFPLRSHAAQTEYDIILSGAGFIHDGADKTERLVAGDHVICHPNDNRVAARFAYHVRVLPVGPEDSALGSPPQMRVLTQAASTGTSPVVAARF